MSTEARAWPNKKAALPAQGLKSKPQQHDNKEQQQEARTRNERKIKKILSKRLHSKQLLLREGCRQGLWSGLIDHAGDSSRMIAQYVYPTTFAG